MDEPRTEGVAAVASIHSVWAPSEASCFVHAAGSCHGQAHNDSLLKRICGRAAMRINQKHPLPEPNTSTVAGTSKTRLLEQRGLPALG